MKDMMTQSVIDLVRNRINITFPTITDVRSTRRYHVLNEHIREFGFRVGVELGVSSGETFFKVLDANPNLFLYGVDTWILQKDNYTEDYDKEGIPLEQRKKTVFSLLSLYPLRCKIYEERTDKAHEHFENDSLEFPITFVLVAKIRSKTNLMVSTSVSWLVTSFS